MIKTIYIYDDRIGCVSLIDSMGDDARAAHAARASFLKDEIDYDNQELSYKDKKLTRFLLRERHTSPFEHSVLSFRIKVPLFVRSQIMRHRTFSYNEVSRRYTSFNIEFHTPKELRCQADSNLQCSSDRVVFKSSELTALMEARQRDCLALYSTLINEGVSREQARAVLPQSLYTTFWMTGNLHNWIKFLQLRLDTHAQPETQEVAKAVYELMTGDFPETLLALKDLGIL